MAVGGDVGCENVFASKPAPTGFVQFPDDSQGGKESQQLRSQNRYKHPLPNGQNPPHTFLSPPTSPMLRRSHFPDN